MTTSNTPEQRIDELLDNLDSELHTESGERVISDKPYDDFKSSLKTLFETMMAEVVGEDEDAEPLWRNEHPDAAQEVETANVLRREQRQRIPQVISKYLGEAGDE